MKNLIPLTVIAALTASGLSNAQVAYSQPRGYVTIPIPGTGGATPTRMQIASQQLLPVGSVKFTGVAESFSGNVLTDNQGTWAAGDFFDPNPPAGFPGHSHLVEITSGPLTGTLTWITGSAANTLTTYDNISAAGTNVSYKVLKAFTVSTLFGAVPTNTALAGGTSGSVADNFLLFNSSTNSYTTFYYKNGGFGGGTGWRSAASISENVASVAIHPNDSGLMIVRRQAADGELIIAGDVKMGVTDVVIRGGGGTGPKETTLNIIQALIPADQITLGTCGLYTGDPATGLMGGSSGATADNVLIYNSATGNYTTYYYKNGGFGGGTGWRSAASISTDVAATKLPATSAILIQRRNNGSDFTWKIPAVQITEN